MFTGAYVPYYIISPLLCILSHSYQTHKVICRQVKPLKALLKAISTPEDKVLTQLNKRRHYWTKENMDTLAVACVAALSLHENTSQAATHLLHVTLTSGSDSSGTFKLQDAKVISLAEARDMCGIGDEWEECVRIFESQRDRRGNMVAVAVDLSPLPVYFLQLRAKSFVGAQSSPDWLRSLKSALND
jgi:hypothetical protein